MSFGGRKQTYRKLTEQEQQALAPFQEEIHYSARYNDDDYEYRHVILPKLMLKAIPKDYFDHESGTLRLLHEDEWRGLGITQVSFSSTARTRPIVRWVVLSKRSLRLGSFWDDVEG